MSKGECRWGILGAAVIAQKNWQSIHNSGNGTILAVASRDREKAARFIQARQQECPFPVEPDACTYEELLARSDIDAVYIPLPTGLRKEWVIRAARAGKHVMCEKPCAVHADELREMLQVCHEHRVQFMDGVMFMHSQRLQAIRGILNDGLSIGDIRRISSHFSFRAPDEFLASNIRVSSELEPHGCLGDLGWYCIRFALWALNSQMPVEISARLLAHHGRADSPDVVPMELSAELKFPNDVSFGFFCSFLIEQQQTATISGTRGYLHVSDFVLPNFGNEVAFQVINNDFQVAGCRFNMSNHTRRVAVNEYSNNHPNAQETRLFRHFGDLVQSGQIDETWGEVALKTQIIVDACLESARNNGRCISPCMEGQA